MSLTDFNNEDLLAVSRLFKVISDPTRLAILFFYAKDLPMWDKSLIK